jgi:glycosyltransferase involved in cell wall biosynthesis
VRRILIYRKELLAASETFIAGQAASLKRYSPWFAGLKREPGGLTLDPARVLSLTTENRLRDKLARRAYLRAGLAPQFHLGLRSIRPSLIHAHFAPDGAGALTLLQHLIVPLIVTLHGYDVTADDDTLRRTLHGRTYLRRRTALLRKTALFVCVSEHIRQRAIERGFPPEKLAVLRIGIELPQIDSTQEREQIVLFVGRMVEKKGCIHLLHAMEMVEARMPEARLVLLGGGPLQQELERDAKARLRNAIFLGMQPHREVHRWMQRAQVLAAPSIIARNGDSEGLPTVLCEAQALGLPIASFHGPGVDEAVVENKTALLAPQGDEQALGEAILRLLSDRGLQKDLAAAGQRRAAELFDIQKQTALLEERYDEIVSQFAWSRN